MDLQTILKPVMGAFIGYSTNWLAIKMLFKPYNKVKIAGIPLPFTPGLIPRERDRIAASLGAAVGRKLLTKEVIVKELTSPVVIDSMRDYIMEALTRQPMTLGDLLVIIFGENAEEQKDRIASSIAESIKTALESEEGDMLDEALFANKREISMFIASQLDKDELKMKAAEMVQTMIEEKLGALGAMFLDAGSLTGTLVVKVQQLLDKEETQDMIVETLIAGKNELIAEQLKTEHVADYVKGFLINYLDRPILLSDEDKKAIEKIIETQYVNFATSHIPVFIESFNIETVVQKEISGFSIRELEELIFAIVDRELKAITWFGALLGFALGLFLI